MLTVALTALLAMALVMAATTLVAHRLGRVSIVDVTWGLLFVAAAAGSASVGDAPLERRLLVLALTAVWGLRLAWHIAGKQRGHGEDPRYVALMKGRGFGYAIRKVFGLQLLIASVIAWPLVTGAQLDARWPALVWVGVGVWLVGLAFEAVGDAQLAAYKRDRDRGPVMDRGLWGWTRHPNYFGDACVWWGLWLVGGLAAGWVPGLVTVLSPLAMTYFLVRVSGVRLTEQTMMKRPGYADYAARVPMFVPRPPRR